MRKIVLAASALLAAAAVPFGCELFVHTGDLHPEAADAAAPPCTMKITAHQSCADAGTYCGVDGGDDCCGADRVEGGTYYRGGYADSDGGVSPTTWPATVGAFYLDRYEVTVGRFKEFLAAPCTLPPPDAGALDGVPASGWDPRWDMKDPSEIRSEMTNGSCSANSIQVVGTLAAGDDALPINCVRWQEAFAFCVWDGGRLPTEAEWNLAAAGGPQQRIFPWSNPPWSVPSMADAQLYAVVEAAAPERVGARPLGVGAFGQLDLSGNVGEWVLDAFADYVVPCSDCATTVVDGGIDRVSRGGSYAQSPMLAESGARLPVSGGRFPGRGIRCARDEP